MVVSLKRAITAANYADNLCRWDQRSMNHYEVWFITLNQRASRRGFWFRYVVESPVGSEPVTGLWAAVFDRDRPSENLALKQEYAVDRFGVDGKQEFRIRVDNGEFTATHAAGQVEQGGHSISWDLGYEPNQRTYHHVTPAVVNLARPSSFVCSPNLNTRFSGTIVVDGREYQLEDEPGCQSHLWGRKHVDEWVWVHANAFDGNADTVFEGLAARPRRAGRVMPPIQSLYLRHHGEEHRFVRLRFSEQWKRNLGSGHWSFTATNTRVHLEGVAQCRLRDMTQAEYHDPDGEPLYCINSEVANLKIRIFRRVRGIRYRHVETVSAHATAHLEHAARRVDPSVALGFSSVTPA